MTPDATPSTSLLRDPKRWVMFAAILGVFCLVLSVLPTSAVDDIEIGHWSSVLPPLVAVVVSIVFRELLVALGSAIGVGALLAFWDSSRDALVDVSPGLQVLTPFAALVTGFHEFIMSNLADEWNLTIFLFTFALVGLVHVISRNGGVHGLIKVVVRFAKTAKSTRVATALMGLVVFFDDYANSVVVGTTMRRLSDERSISREKLAYLVDSTAAPVSGIALISTWVAMEVGLFQDFATTSGLDTDGYSLFLSILPFRFYCLAALAFVFVNAFSGRDFGPMLTAERRAAEHGKVLADDAKPLASTEMDSILPPEGAPLRWYNAVVPIMVVIFSVIIGMFWDGRAALVENDITFNLLHLDTWRTCFGGADAARVLFWGSLFGSGVAIWMGSAQKIVTVKDSATNWAKAIPAMKLACTILLLAWAIKSTCDALNTDGYLISVLGDGIPLPALPVAIFVLAAIVAFSTGTSWGTMGILIPVALPLAFQMSGGEPENMIYVLLCASAVLDGAIFGDHCSPISDTTVLSSLASGCDHLHHVRTQFPYALVTMIIAALCGYVGVALGLPIAVAYPLILVSIIVVMYTVGKPIAREIAAK